MGLVQNVVSIRHINVPKGWTETKTVYSEDHKVKVKLLLKPKEVQQNGQVL